MTEKKTFKNPYDVNTTVSGYEPSVVTHSVEGNKFRSSDWDMEVTFTKKPEQFQVGEKVNVADSWYYAGGVVLVQYKDQVVVVDDADDIEIYDAATLEHS